MAQAKVGATRLWAVPLLLAGLCFAAYTRLPGRTSQAVRVDLDEPDRPPAADGSFSVGPLRWDVPAYRAAPSLAPFRELFAEHCPGRQGLAAATCMSDVFARAFKHGNPTTEFLHATYDPAAALALHLNGAPGHCVTRSGLLATTLLSVGIPTRQVQVMTGDVGHNLLTVWDAESGWASFDPSTGTVFEEDAHLLSTHRAVTSDRGTAKQVALASMPGIFFTTISELRKAGVKPEVLYPEPWLYTRVGERRAAWPFRGLFVHTGAAHWSHGPAQAALRWAMVLLVGLSLAVRLRGARHSSHAGQLGEPAELVG